MLQLLGAVKNPFEAFNSPYGNLTDENGLIFFISNLIKLAIVAAGLFAFINLLIAGFQYISSGGDTKLTQAALSRINMSLIGLVVIVGSFALAATIGLLFFGDPNAILNPTIYGPGDTGI